MKLPAPQALETTDLLNINSEFFIIDSENLKNVENKLYGYCFVNNEFIETYEDMKSSTPDGEGAYVYVENIFDKIYIKQDFIGTYGLYLYKTNNYFAISNSFLYLVDYLKNKHKITLNKDYANAFLVADLCSVSYYQTMINEIIMLDRNAEISIDIPKKTLDISNKDYFENTVDIDSAEGIRILDNWYNKWTNIIHNLKQQTNRISVDLSGGFDSRLTFNMFLGADINLNEICISSIKDNLHTHKEDYAIASDISKYYGFSLNNRSNMAGCNVNFSINDSLNVSFYPKLSFHKQMYLKYDKAIDKIFTFGGAAGECIRDYWNMTPEQYIANQTERVKRYFSSIQIDCSDIQNSTKKIIEASFDAIQNKYKKMGRNVSSDYMTLNLYRETRCRNHFGKAMVEDYLSGRIRLSPLLDPSLHKLTLNSSKCKDKNLLMAIIFTRYNRELIDFKFEGGRCISEFTINYAKNINTAFPFVKKAFLPLAKKELLSSNIKKSISYINNEKVSSNYENEFLKNTFLSNKTRKIFELLYDERIYDLIVKDLNNRKYFPLQETYPIIAICKILQSIMINEDMYIKDFAQYLKNQQISNPHKKNSSLINYPYLENYITARLDIKNHGSDSNNIKITHISDSNAIISTPLWFNKNGIGHVIQSKSGNLDIELECINSGKLKIELKGQDVRDEFGREIPFLIDYTNFIINNDKVFDSIHAAFHNNPIKHVCNVKNGEKIRISVKWLPHKVKYNEFSSFNIKQPKVKKNLLYKILHYDKTK